MPTLEMWNLFTDIARERGVEKGYVIDTFKTSLASVVKKKFGKTAEVEVEMSEETGEIKMYRIMTVVRAVVDSAFEFTKEEAKQYKKRTKFGEKIKIEYSLEEFGRNAIILVKQVLFQGIRQKEKEINFEKFREKIGEIINATVTQVTSKGVYLNLTNVEAFISKNDIIPGEKVYQGNNIRALIKDVEQTPRGPRVILSRTHPNYLKKLLEAEIPEVYEKIVEIIAVARDPGNRSKVAVYSNDDKIDPVGACVGVRGSRIQSIVRELNGENIDVIQWSVDSGLFVSRALSPAKIYKTIITEEEKKITVIIPEEQLSLAIGKNGVNTRLANKLTGWSIDILSKEEYKKHIEETKLAQLTIRDYKKLSKGIKDKLERAGYFTFQNLEELVEEDLIKIPGIGKSGAQKILKAYEKITKQIEEEEKSE
ncbi:MAG: transcription termination/antitermination protein NusA [Candidatus Cloacimonadota bacterium]|nr:MAG: transcription termination/antitermination protein NusA [Candidatus Cloacimonadota bacterium]